MIPLEPDGFYHLYNRAIANEPLFLGNENYLFFLEKFQKHIFPIADVYCYCLMPNHFHFLIRIKDREALVQLQQGRNSNGKKEQSIAAFCSKQFSNLFSSYTQSFNKQQNRMGSLFLKNFKRKRVEEEGYLYQLIHYIHYNPIAASLVTDLRDWRFSSYRSFLSQRRTALKRQEVLGYYGDLENFIRTHAVPPKELNWSF